MRVLKLYLEGNGIRSIERTEKVTDTTIIEWIREYGKRIKEKVIEEVNDIPDSLKDIKEKKNIVTLEEDENEI